MMNAHFNDAVERLTYARLHVTPSHPAFAALQDVQASLESAEYDEEEDDSNYDDCRAKKFSIEEDAEHDALVLLEDRIESLDIEPSFDIDSIVKKIVEYGNQRAEAVFDEANQPEFPALREIIDTLLQILPTARG
ncbi:hypothetical protein [Aquirhabdus parva]|uniref:Uncharacterized protein n=1 Tax=Aquirhabdus parva TaxID=2283318 RepID=A0A345PAP2_9GAMM|nr:hypothetical protein [Aquirhabdus parva]AXI04351.1 hypothetical protein HYN46_16820 [Aquirhabdus parva]AXI04395.1 hypothetical protein HYN46_17065 [Aquirhabdus parva]